MKPIKDITNFNHLWDLRFLMQLHPRIYEMVQYHFENIKDNLEFWIWKELSDDRINFLYSDLLDFLQDLEYVLFDLWYLKSESLEKQLKNK